MISIERAEQVSLIESVFLAKSELDRVCAELTPEEVGYIESALTSLAKERTELHNKLDILAWWMECLESDAWSFWLEDDPDEELAMTCNKAWGDAREAVGWSRDYTIKFQEE